MIALVQKYLLWENERESRGALHLTLQQLSLSVPGLRKHRRALNAFHGLELFQQPGWQW